MKTIYVSWAAFRDLCGSCWAFATIGVLEGINRLINNQVLDLSEQSMVNCVESVDASGNCDGNILHNAFDFLTTSKVPLESSAPARSSSVTRRSCT